MNYQQPTPTTLLRQLRGLVPVRTLSHQEALRIAELQANRFRELLGITQPKLPEEAISHFPRIEVRRDGDLPVSGLTFWKQGRWVVCLNAHEPAGRQRFSLGHEFKHVLDHTSTDRLVPGGTLSVRERAERVADFFAGCLLMPKRHVKRLFGERLTLTAMADAFGVTQQAMQVRLSQLGLTEPTPRCDWTGRISRGPSVYERQAPVAA